MHLLISLVIVAGGALSDGLPQYQPPRSLQQPYYKPPVPPVYSTVHDASRPLLDHKMYTYAEVNTPYYQYHYYSPVHKTYQHQPPLLEAPLPESSIRNEVNPINSFYYPATTVAPLYFPEPGLRNNGYAPGYNPGTQLFSPTFNNGQEVHITSKPITVNSALPPMFRSYQSPVPNKVHRPPVAPVTTPTELASGFPNILRESYGNDKNSEIPMTYQTTTLKPELIAPVSEDTKLFMTPIIVPESLATPSSTIIKDEVRRGISPQLVLLNEFSKTPKKSSLENSSSKTDTIASTSPTQFSIPLQKSIHPSTLDAESGRISANILRVFSTPNIELPQNHTYNTSFGLPTKTESTEMSDESASIFSDSSTESNPHASTQIAIDTTLTHRQKIAKKINPTVVPNKKVLFKNPNVLFYSPGHDFPK